MTIVDTGPLVALLNGADPHHGWAVSQSKALNAPLTTCEAVLTESFFLIASSQRAVSRLFDLLESGVLLLEHPTADNLHDIRELMRKYSDLPMSFADACLVRMAEAAHDVPVFTLDSHFKSYRQADRRPIPVVMPR